MLTIKLVLVPTFIALIAVSGRLWGSAVAGLLSGLPVIAGPILWLIYLENGLEFAQQAAIATVGGIVALSFFCFAYSWFFLRFILAVALLLSAAIYFAAFPIASSTIAIFSLRNYSANHAIRALKFSAVAKS